MSTQNSSVVGIHLDGITTTQLGRLTSAQKPQDRSEGDKVTPREKTRKEMVVQFWPENSGKRLRDTTNMYARLESDGKENILAQDVSAGGGGGGYLQSHASDL